MHSMRIVSLLPSATEIICSLDLLPDLVGVTHECDYPQSVKSLPKVTRTIIPHDASSVEIDSLVRTQLKSTNALYSLNMDLLKEIAPDLIVTQALCNVCAVAEEEVREAACTLPGKPNVINLEPMTLDDVFETIRLVGEATGYEDKAEDVLSALQKRVESVKQRTVANISIEKRPRVVFLEWIDPPFNPGHWNSELIELAGGIDCIGNKNKPSRTIEWQAVIDADPEVLFIACCGFDVERTLQDIEILKSKPGWPDLPCVKNRRVYVTDGNAYFSRSGPRLVDSLEIIAHALHPDVHLIPAGIPPALVLT